ncbi:hypothetical protein BIW11_05956 [Tropilaelaps mercedesae]|uniref:Uncharacterized protein n=1 Tax=Tropilaelaps mercedesae TaxID=418985 RepID=A0A1V9Y071_9ACAR|nr:hypothetical protein BIW11_05956 [Tropilaelaps mercedesae]
MLQKFFDTWQLVFPCKVFPKFSVRRSVCDSGTHLELEKMLFIECTIYKSLEAWYTCTDGCLMTNMVQLNGISNMRHMHLWKETSFYGGCSRCGERNKKQELQQLLL